MLDKECLESGLVRERKEIQEEERIVEDCTQVEEEGRLCPHIDDLPPEIAMIILHWLPETSLIALRNVSRIWRARASHHSLVTKFHIIIDLEMTEQIILKTISSKPSLISVSMDYANVTGNIINTLQKHQTVEILHVVEREGVNYSSTHSKLTFNNSKLNSS